MTSAVSTGTTVFIQDDSAFPVNFPVQLDGLNFPSYAEARDHMAFDYRWFRGASDCSGAPESGSLSSSMYGAQIVHWLPVPSMQDQYDGCVLRLVALARRGVRGTIQGNRNLITWVKTRTCIVCHPPDTAFKFFRASRSKF